MTGKSLIMALLLAGATNAALAQVPLASPTGSPALPPPASAARDPISLPGDALPPTLAASLAPPRPPAARPPEVRAMVPGPAMDIALAAAQAALARCRADGLTVGVAVSDSLGVLKLGLQMDGANPGRIYNAARKNLAAIEFGVPTSVTRQKLRDGDFATLARVPANMTLFPGAVPLISDGKPIGAIGVSGATSAQDEACAAAGAAAVAGRL